MLQRRMNKRAVSKFNRPTGAVVVARESSHVDEFYKVNGVSSDSGVSGVHYVDPIYLLFNQKRLEQMGSDSALDYLKSMINGGSDSLSELRSKCSDEDLLATIKSRHLQSPSEILAWSRYMSNNMNKFNAAVEEVKAQAEANAAATSSIEPTV